MRRSTFFRASVALATATLAVSIASTLGARWLAAIIIEGQGVGAAFGEASRDFVEYPQATLFLLGPWLAKAWLVFTNRNGRRDLRCLMPYFLALLINTFLYFDAQLATAGYVQKRMWTAAALTTGFSCFYATGVLTIAALVSRFLARKAPSSIETSIEMAEDR